MLGRSSNPGIRGIALALLSWCGARASAHAVEPPIEALFKTEVVYPQDQGEVQLTIGGSWQLDDRSAGELAAEYGLTDSWEIGLEWDGVVANQDPAAEGAIGPGDLSLSTRYTFMDALTSDLHASFGFELGLPTGDADSDLGEGALVYAPFAIVAFDLPTPAPAQVFSQFGVGFVDPVEDFEEGESPTDEIFWSSGFFFSLGDLRITQEITWETDTWSGGDEDLVYWTPGLVWHGPFGVEAGLGIPVGLTADTAPVGLMALLTTEFELPGASADD